MDCSVHAFRDLNISNTFLKSQLNKCNILQTQAIDLRGMSAGLCWHSRQRKWQKVNEITWQAHSPVIGSVTSMSRQQLGKRQQRRMYRLRIPSQRRIIKFHSYCKRHRSKINICIPSFYFSLLHFSNGAYLYQVPLYPRRPIDISLTIHFNVVCSKLYHFRKKRFAYMGSLY